MKGFTGKGHLRCISFAAACLIAVSDMSYTGDTVSVSAVTEDSGYRSWKQYDDEWNYLHLGKSSYTMGGSGCAATALSFLLVHAGNYSENNFNPGIFCRLMSQYGGFGNEGDILWWIVKDVAPGFRYRKTDYFDDVPETYEARFERIKEYYDQGYYLIIDVQDSGHWVAVDRIENDRIISFDSGGDRDTDVYKQYDWKGTTCIKVFESMYTSSRPPECRYNYTKGNYRITTDLNVRKDPSTGQPAVGKIAEGTVVSVKGISGEWGKIIYNNTAAWICLEYGIQCEEEPDPDAPVVLPLITEPVTQTTVTTAAATATVTTTEKPVTTTVTTTEKSVTTKVTTTEKPVTTTVTTTVNPVTTAVTSAETQTTTVTEENRVYITGKYRTTDWLNFRRGPDVSEEKYGTLSPDTDIEVTEILGRWGRISFGGRDCWVCLDYAELTEAAEAQTPEASSSEENSASQIPEASESLIPDDVVPDEVIGSAAQNSVVIKAQPDEFGVIRGDVDRNGLINILDYIKLKSAFGSGSDTELSDEADLNNDGAVTMQDFILLKILFLSANKT